MGKVWRNHGLTLVMAALFFIFWSGQSIAGWLHHNEDQREHGKPELPWSEYVRSGDFLESTFENWESEFFQMAAFVFLAGRLRQRGSAQSKEDEDGGSQAGGEKQPDSPAPVHRGGLVLKLYNHSLTLAFAGLFFFSFSMHAWGGLEQFNEEARAHGTSTESLLGYVTSSAFWFQSFQNWQSEFLAVASIVVLSIFLREKDSPESKPVPAPHRQTGH
jgi:hypothetical protein